MNYKIEYYDKKLQEAILQLPRTLLARYISLTDRMQVFGPHLGEPHTKALGQGLFELRLKGEEGIARVFYCTQVGKRILVLHSFLKKSNKTPMIELRLAKQRLKEVKHVNP